MSGVMMSKGSEVHSTAFFASWIVVQSINNIVAVFPTNSPCLNVLFSTMLQECEQGEQWLRFIRVYNFMVTSYRQRTHSHWQIDSSIDSSSERIINPNRTQKKNKKVKVFPVVFSCHCFDAMIVTRVARFLYFLTVCSKLCPKKMKRKWLESIAPFNMYKPE